MKNFKAFLLFSVVAMLFGNVSYAHDKGVGMRKQTKSSTIYKTNFEKINTCTGPVADLQTNYATVNIEVSPAVYNSPNTETQWSKKENAKTSGIACFTRHVKNCSQKVPFYRRTC